MGNLIPICYLSIGSHMDPPRGGSKSHHKNRSVKNRYKIDKLSENVQKNDSRGYPGGDQRSNIFRSFSVLAPLGLQGLPQEPPGSPQESKLSDV